MTHDQFKKAADYWKNKKQNAMPEEKLKKDSIGIYQFQQYLCTCDWNWGLCKMYPN